MQEKKTTIGKKVSNHILGYFTNDNLSRQTLTIFSFATVFLVALSLIMNIISGLPLLLIVVNAFGILFFLTCFIGFRYARKHSQYIYIKWFFSIGTVIFIDMIWFSNFGSFGPGLYTQLILLILLLLVWSGKSRMILLAFFCLNLIGLFIIENKYSESIGYYEDEFIRLTDIYGSLLMFALLVSLIVINIKNRYVKEKEKAIESDKLKSAFLANLSHEIRTPMNAIMGFSDLLETVNDTEKQKTYIKLINSNSLSLLRIIDDIIEISKIQTGDYQIFKQETEISGLFDKLFEVSKLELKRFSRTGLKLEYSIEPKGLKLELDRFKTQQILAALLSNAIKFSKNGTIHLHCSLSNGLIIFSVRDEGMGIPAGVGNRIFERFFKLDNYDPNMKGTGIGLSIAQDLVEILEGKIWYESTFRKGTVFYVQLPA